MFINLTLVVQIANFLATCYVLNRIFFHPFITFLEKRRAQEQNLSSRAERETEIAEKLVHEKARRLQDFQDHLERAYSPPEKQLEPPPTELPAYDRVEADPELIREAADYITERISDAK